jgi:hypothetical protein
MKHPERPTDWFCFVCKDLICVECCVREHHSCATIQHVNEVTEDQKSSLYADGFHEIKDKLLEVKDALVPFVENLDEHVGILKQYVAAIDTFVEKYDAHSTLKFKVFIRRMFESRALMKEGTILLEDATKGTLTPPDQEEGEERDIETASEEEEEEEVEERRLPKKRKLSGVRFHVCNYYMYTEKERCGKKGRARGGRCAIHTGLRENIKPGDVFGKHDTRLVCGVETRTGRVCPNQTMWARGIGKEYRCKFHT